MSPETHGLQEEFNSKSSETRLTGRSVSRGVAIGRALAIFGENRQFYRTQLPPERIRDEIARYRAAHERASLDLISASKSIVKSSSSASIFDLHRAILDDSSIAGKIEGLIETQSVNAEWAVKLVMDEYIAKYRAIPDEHFRDRYIDVEDVAEQLQAALGGKRESVRVPPSTIIIAQGLRPSTLAELGSENLAGIVTESGGWTSHSFILARELEVPAVTGIRKLLRRVKSGDTLVVDGFEGNIFVNPSDETIKKYQQGPGALPRKNPGRTVTGDKLKTLDGIEIKIRANFDLPESFQRARKLGARGVGLFRSEYLFNRSSGFPSETEQFETYCQIGDYAGKDRARIRTFDLSVTQLGEFTKRNEPNPALGLRGIRLSLHSQEHFRTQLRALLKASHGRSIDIILPMVSSADEIRAVKTIIRQETLDLHAKGCKIGSPGIGAMIEVPSAAINIRSILKEADCVCVGTNDLVQYMLGVDRDNEAVAPWFRTLDPSIVITLKSILDAAIEAGKPAVICGEMAGSPFYVPLLIGLGATELSMNVNSIEGVRKVIAGIAFEETRELISRVDTCVTSDEVEETLEAFFTESWKHLYSLHDRRRS
jgi:phosphoenolpyruvate-protein phosphotransferase (PTS system enzyme I)